MPWSVYRVEPGVHNLSFVCLLHYKGSMSANSPTVFLTLGSKWAFCRYLVNGVNACILSEWSYGNGCLRWGSSGRWCWKKKLSPDYEGSWAPVQGLCPVFLVGRPLTVFQWWQTGIRSVWFFWLWFKGSFERSIQAGEQNAMNWWEPVRKEGVHGRALGEEISGFVFWFNITGASMGQEKEKNSIKGIAGRERVDNGFVCSYLRHEGNSKWVSFAGSWLCK